VDEEVLSPSEVELIVLAVADGMTAFNKASVEDALAWAQRMRRSDSVLDAALLRQVLGGRIALNIGVDIRFIRRPDNATERAS